MTPAICDLCSDHFTSEDIVIFGREVNESGHLSQARHYHFGCLGAVRQESGTSRNDETFSSIRELSEQLAKSGVTQDQQVLKIAEEYGEVAKAWFGVNGWNKRKGFTHEIGHVLDELADVAITALVAIEMLGVPSDLKLRSKLAGVREDYKDVK